jgi:hypothetical protein
MRRLERLLLNQTNRQSRALDSEGTLMTDTIEEPAPNHFVRPIIVISLILVGVWNLAGWWMSEGPTAFRMLTAGLTLMFELLGANVSAQKGRADMRAVSANVRRFWFVALIMCAGWSAFSAHHALELFTPGMSDWARAPAIAVLTVAAICLPLAPWAVERTATAPLLPTPTPANAPQSEAPSSPQAPTRYSLREAGRAAIAASVVGAPTAQSTQHTEWRAPAAHVRNARDEVWRAQAHEMWIAGERNKSAIARAVGRPRETVRRALRALGV